MGRFEVNILTVLIHIANKHRPYKEAERDGCWVQSTEGEGVGALVTAAGEAVPALQCQALVTAAGEAAPALQCQASADAYFGRLH